MNGPRPGKELKGLAHTSGISLRTLSRARARLHVSTHPNGYSGPWLWKLPKPVAVRQDPVECAVDTTECADDDVSGLKSDLLTDPSHVRADCRMVVRFGVQAELRPFVTAQLLEIIMGRLDPETGKRGRSKPREIISATLALARIDELNMKQEKHHAEIASAYLAQQRGEEHDVAEATTQAERIRHQIIAMDQTIMPPGQQPGPASNGNGKA